MAVLQCLSRLSSSVHSAGRVASSPLFGTAVFSLVGSSEPAVASEALRLLGRLFAPQAGRVGAVPWSTEEYVTQVRRGESGCGDGGDRVAGEKGEREPECQWMAVGDDPGSLHPFSAPSSRSPSRLSPSVSNAIQTQSVSPIHARLNPIALSHRPASPTHAPQATKKASLAEDVALSRAAKVALLEPLGERVALIMQSISGPDARLAGARACPIASMAAVECIAAVVCPPGKCPVPGRLIV